MKKIRKKKKNKENKINKLITILLIINIFLLIILGFTQYIILNYNIPPKNIEINPINLNNSELNCSNLNLTETAKCLNDFVNMIFKYKVTPDNITLNLSQLESLGGDCKDWNQDFYKNYMEYYGFNTTTNTFLVDTENDTEIFHTTTIAFNNASYCNMDMLEINCFNYEDG